METQKIVNLLNDSNNESSKFATRKWYIINDQNNGQYEEMKMIQLLNLKQMSLNQILGYIYSCDRRYKSCRCCCRY